MSERTSYEPGTPSWVELGTPDMEATIGFYNALLDWDIPEQPNSVQLGGYRRAKLRDKDVAGVSPLQQEGQPPAWSTYISVADAAATVEAVKAAGGTVMFEPLDVVGLGTMAIFTDPTGAVFGIWQPGTFAGAELVNEYGAFSWNELHTRDAAAAKEFYGAVFGWTVEEQDMGEMGTYSVFKLGEDMVGGMLDMAAMGMPDEIPPNWLTYFTVENTDAAIETIKGNGGSVLNGPIDIPIGRFAIVTDNAGAAFAVMQPNEETLAEMP
ncbi:MAG TPA: VOC family protein [Solirubrobacterales bacterium]|nr:VOC family protein [Solirubrobacterales bacterium]